MVESFQSYPGRYVIYVYFVQVSTRVEAHATCEYCDNVQEIAIDREAAVDSRSDRTHASQQDIDPIYSSLAIKRIAPQ